MMREEARDVMELTRDGIRALAAKVAAAHLPSGEGRVTDLAAILRMFTPPR
jgi:hypothetical protein